MMKMKRMLAAMMTACLLLLTGCEFSSNSMLMSVEKETRTSCSVRYAKFNGRKQHVIRTYGDTRTILLDVVTESGTLGVTVKDKDGQVIYEAEGLKTGASVIALPESGKYTVIMRAEEHSGSYALDWAD